MILQIRKFNKEKNQIWKQKDENMWNQKSNFNENRNEDNQNKTC